MKFYNKYGKEINLVDFDYLNKQLLVNNDFQINQRGQSEYFTTGNRIRTLDMWAILSSNTTTKLTVLNKGVKLESLGSGSGVLTQRINIEKVSNYTVVINAKNIVGNTIVEIYYMNNQYETHNLENGINVINISNKSIRDISPTIRGQGSIDIEYIDLFEGDIAYPHVKKRYTTDLLECRLYYIKKWINVVISYKYTDKEVKVYGEIPEMIKAPTCNIIEANCTDSSSNGNELKTIKNNWVKDYYGYEARLEFLRSIHQSCNSIHILVELSCEPI